MQRSLRCTPLQCVSWRPSQIRRVPQAARRYLCTYQALPVVRGLAARVVSAACRVVLTLHYTESTARQARSRTSGHHPPAAGCDVVPPPFLRGLLRREEYRPRSQQSCHGQEEGASREKDAAPPEGQGPSPQKKSILPILSDPPPNPPPLV